MKKYNILSNAQYVDCPFDANGNFKQGKTFADLTAWYEYAFTLGLIEPTIFTITATYTASSLKYVQGATLISKITKITNTSGSIIAEGNSACRSFINDNTTSACTLTFHVDSDTYVNLFKEAFRGNTALTQAIFVDWDTATVTTTYPHTGMFVEAFSGCTALTDVTLPLYSMEDVAGTDTTDMFSGCTALADIHCYSDYMTTKSWTSSGTDVVVPHEGLTVHIDKEGVVKSLVENIKCYDSSEPPVPVEPTFIPPFPSGPTVTLYQFTPDATTMYSGFGVPADDPGTHTMFMGFTFSGAYLPLGSKHTLKAIVDGTEYILSEQDDEETPTILHNNMLVVSSGVTIDLSLSVEGTGSVYSFGSLSELPTSYLRASLRGTTATATAPGSSISNFLLSTPILIPNPITPGVQFTGSFGDPFSGDHAYGVYGTTGVIDLVPFLSSSIPEITPSVTGPITVDDSIPNYFYIHLYDLG